MSLCWKMDELHVILDTQIILIFSNMSNIPCGPHHLSLKGMFAKQLFLAIDNNGFIRAEYEKKMGAHSVGRIWLGHLASTGRLKSHYAIKALPRKLRVALENAHFHQGDCKFLRLALETPSKLLVAEDADYSNKVKRILKREGICLHSAESFCGEASIPAEDDVLEKEIGT